MVNVSNETVMGDTGPSEPGHYCVAILEAATKEISRSLSVAQRSPCQRAAAALPPVEFILNGHATTLCQAKLPLRRVALGDQLAVFSVFRMIEQS